MDEDEEYVATGVDLGGGMDEDGYGEYEEEGFEDWEDEEEEEEVVLPDPIYRLRL